MERENASSEQPEVVQTSNSKLNTITPLSKYLAMALFIILPFVGGWLGYTYAPEKIVEVEKIVPVEQKGETEPINVTTDSTDLSIYTDNDHVFSFEFPRTWRTQVIDKDYGLYLPPDGLKHILVIKDEHEQGLIVSLVKIENLSDFFGCFTYTYNSSLGKWERQDSTETDRCFDETGVKSHENPSLEANYKVGEISSLKTSGRNPTNVLIPFSKTYGLNVTYIDWKGETALGEIPPEAKTIIDSLQFTTD